MKLQTKVLILLGFFALASLPQEAFADRRTRQQRKNNVDRVNKRNKRGLKKWGLAQVVRWEEVSHG